MTHEDVIRWFAQRKVNQSNNQVAFSAAPVSCEGNLLFSHEIPIAVYLGLRRRRHFFVKNVDKDGPSRHQNMVNQHCFGPCVSRRALSKAGITFRELKLDNFLIVRDEFCQLCYRDHEGQYWLGMDWDSFPHDDCTETGFRSIDAPYDPPIPVFSKPWKPPQGGQFFPSGRSNGWYEEGCWIIGGACVIKFCGTYWLCSRHDTPARDNKYIEHGIPFCAKLRVKPTSIDHALKLTRGPGATLVQGPWSFTPTDLTTKDVAQICGKSISGIRRLPPRSMFGSEVTLHQCRYILNNDLIMYCTGKVFHRHGTESYKAVDLGDRWWTAYRHSPYYT